MIRVLSPNPPFLSFHHDSCPLPTNIPLYTSFVTIHLPSPNSPNLYYVMIHVPCPNPLFTLHHDLCPPLPVPLFKIYHESRP